MTINGAWLFLSGVLTGLLLYWLYADRAGPLLGIPTNELSKLETTRDKGPEWIDPLWKEEKPDATGSQQ
jgi:hypothetical protein